MSQEVDFLQHNLPFPSLTSHLLLRQFCEQDAGATFQTPVLQIAAHIDT